MHREYSTYTIQQFKLVTSSQLTNEQRKSNRRNYKRREKFEQRKLVKKILSTWENLYQLKNRNCSHHTTQTYQLCDKLSERLKHRQQHRQQQLQQLQLHYQQYSKKQPATTPTTLATTHTSIMYSSPSSSLNKSSSLCMTRKKTMKPSDYAMSSKSNKSISNSTMVGSSGGKSISMLNKYKSKWF